MLRETETETETETEREGEREGGRERERDGDGEGLRAEELVASCQVSRHVRCRSALI